MRAAGSNKSGCPDIIPKVIQQRGKGSVKKPSPELVNNFAAAHNRGGEQVATPEPRLGCPHPARVRQRSPTPVAAPGPSAERTKEFDQQMQPFGKCPMAIETSSGPAVDQLLQRDYPVFPINPKAAQRYRERKCPSGNKTDRIDAWSLADALRTDGQGWVQLIAQDDATMTLRLICRDENVLIEQRTALVNQLQAALTEYYPLALQSFEDWTKPFAWAFLRSFPTPQALSKAGKRRWEKFLHTQKLWRPGTASTRLEAWQKGQQLNASA